MSDLSYNEATTIVIKWISIAVAIGFIAMGVTETLDSKYKSEIVSSSTESFSKVLVACIESGQTDCDQKYEFSIKSY